MQSNEEVPEAISSKEIWEVVDAVQRARFATYQEDCIQMKRDASGKLTRLPDSNDHVKWWIAKKKEDAEVFKELSGKDKTHIRVNRELESGDIVMTIASDTGIDSGGRLYMFIAELNFGNSLQSAEKLLELVGKNKMVLPNIVSRIFAQRDPSGQLSSYLNTRMEYGEGNDTWLGLSPFIGLANTSIAVKKNT